MTSSAAAALLRKVEAHVRVMGYPDEVLCDGAGGIALAATGDRFSGFAKVHKDTTNDNRAFFEDTLGKVAGLAAAGQSHTILVGGPPSSGRSQTVYDVSGPGMVHLMAERLLQQEDTAVMLTAFHVRGQELYCSFTEEPVAVQDLPPPIGALPLSKMVPLHRARDAVVVPRGKKAASSCFVQFHVHRALSVATASAPRRDAFATVTFVDLTTFEANPSADLQALGHSIGRQVGGGDLGLQRCRLTSLLGTAISGSNTLIAILAVLGKKELAPATATALHFGELVARIDQCSATVHTVAPRWLADLPQQMQRLVTAATANLNAAEQRGVADAHGCFVRAMEARIATLRGQFAPSAGMLEARRHLQSEAATAEAALRRAASAERAEATALRSDLRTAADHATRLSVELRDERGRCSAVARDVEQADNAHAAFMAQAGLETSALEARHTKRQRYVDGAERDAAEAAARSAELASIASKQLEVLQGHTLRLHFENAAAKLDRKKRRLEHSLTDGSSRARGAAEHYREERARLSMMQRLTNVEAKVSAKRATLTNPETSLPRARQSYSPARAMEARPMSPLQRAATAQAHHHDPAGFM